MGLNFYGVEEAYWWILSTEKYFREKNIVDNDEKMKIVSVTMSGRALKWWLWRSKRHPSMSWNTFADVFIWRFKPEWRHLFLELDEEIEEEEPSHESVESAKATLFLDDSVDGKFQDSISESVEEEDIEESSDMCRTQQEQPNWYETQSPLFVEESDSDLKPCSMKSSEECSFVEDSVIDHVLNVGDQRTLNPSSIVKQKQIQVPSPVSSSISPCAKITNYVYVTIPIVEHGFNDGDFHNDANFTIPLKPPDHVFVLNNFIMPPPLLSKVNISCDSKNSLLNSLVISPSCTIINSKTSIDPQVAHILGRGEKYAHIMFSTLAHQLFVKIPLTPIYVNSTLLQEVETILTESLHCSITEFRIAWSWLGLYIIKSFSPFNALLVIHQFLSLSFNFPTQKFLQAPSDAVFRETFSVEYKFKKKGSGELLLLAHPLHIQLLSKKDCNVTVLSDLKYKSIDGDLVGVIGDSWLLKTDPLFVTWHLGHEYLFGSVGDLVGFVKAVAATCLYVHLRISPYACAEWNYGGFPIWLHFISGIKFRTDNEPFKVEMKRFTAKIVDLMKQENLYASQGGFGLVYRGRLDDGTDVAVKVLIKDFHQNGNREFNVEVAILCRLHHRNLVKLIGICTEGYKRCLVYELVRKGSVESHLHGVDQKNNPLDWEARKKIVLGAARGLAYLHEDSNPHVIHRDFKTGNLLLEDDFTPNVSDFGLAREATEGSQSVPTRVMGAFGYVAPEYAMTGNLLVKSDVYSYGVATLTVLIGQSSKHTNVLALNDTAAKHFLSDVEQILMGQGANDDLKQICSIDSLNLTEASCPVKHVNDFYGMVNTSKLLKACENIDPMKECCYQYCHSAILEAATKIASKGSNVLDSDGSHILLEHSIRVNDCRYIVLRWIASKLDPSHGKKVLRGLSNCNINKVCPLVLPDAKHVAKGCGNGISNKTACCDAMESYVSHLQKQSFITNLQALGSAETLAMKLKKKSKIVDDVYSLCHISLKDFSLQVTNQEYGCLLPSLPSDAVFDQTSGVSFLCDLNENIPAPWPPLSSCPKYHFIQGCYLSTTLRTRLVFKG